MGPPKRFKLKTNVLFAKKDLLTQLLYLNPIRTDDFLFRVHYKLSVFILLMVYLTYSRILYKFGILSCIFSNGSNNDGLNSACFALSVYSIDFNEDQMPSKEDKLRFASFGIFQVIELIAHLYLFQGSTTLIKGKAPVSARTRA